MIRGEMGLARRRARQVIRVRAPLIPSWFAYAELLRSVTEDMLRPNSSFAKLSETIIHQRGINDSSEGLDCVEVDGRYGYIDKAGEWAVDPIFEESDAFYQGLAKVKAEGAWGYIDWEEEMVIYGKGKYEYFDPQGQSGGGTTFREGSYFSEGLAMVTVDGKCGYSDKRGNMVIAARYDKAGDLQGGSPTWRWARSKTLSTERVT